MQNKTIMRKAAAALFAVVLGLGAAACGQQAAPAADDATTVKVSVIGPATGAPAFYATETEVALAEGQNAWDASQQVFDQFKLVYDASNTEYGVMLNSINNPLDQQPLAYDEASGCYWQLFVDGVPSEVGIDGVEVADGMSIVWYYSAFGDELPGNDIPVVEPLDNAA